MRTEIDPRPSSPSPLVGDDKPRTRRTDATDVKVCSVAEAAVSKFPARFNLQYKQGKKFWKLHLVCLRLWLNSSLSYFNLAAFSVPVKKLWLWVIRNSWPPPFVLKRSVNFFLLRLTGPPPSQPAEITRRPCPPRAHFAFMQSEARRK